MTDFIEIHWTVGTLDEARKISRYLVQERYVACAQIIPWIESVFMWNNKLDTEQESKIVLKTRRDNYDKIREIIEQNSKYEVPEITWISIDGGNQPYLDWLEESTLVYSKESK
jgi:periplasmic divalent cation tolerance protein